jgi:hypothetical protein
VDIAGSTVLGNGVIGEQLAVTVQPRMLLDSAITLKLKGAIAALSVLRGHSPIVRGELQLVDLGEVVGHGAMAMLGHLREGVLMDNECYP